MPRATAAMADGIAVMEVRWHGVLPAFLLCAAIAASALSAHELSSILPARLWWHALVSPGSDVQMLIFAEAAVPRIVVCWLAGAALALAGVLLQAALCNPLADTTTLGTASGAYLALAACSVYAPALLGEGQEWVALAGAAGAGAVVVAIARGAGFAPVTVILVGLTLNLLCGALGAGLAILNHETLSTLFVWQSGSLVQNGWTNAIGLLPRVALAGAMAALIQRPLATLDLGDQHARAIGVPAGLVRFLAIILAIALGAFTVSTVGVVGFVGLAAGHLARRMGARTLRQRLLWAPVVGALLLWLTDQVVQVIFLHGELPTGSATALLGAPLLLWIMMRRREMARAPLHPLTPIGPRSSRPIVVVLVLVVVLCACCLLALAFGKGAEGWSLLTPASAPGILPWRAPRVAAAAGAGVLLALAGTLMQRMTGNQMASPEMLGVSSGAALGVIALLLIMPGFHRPAMMLAAFAGAAATLGAIIAFNWRSHFAPERLLLAGVALATLFSGFAAVLLTSGDPRTTVLLAWMSGSTYRVTASDAAVAVILAAAMLGAACLGARWLEVLPLGDDTAGSLGVGRMKSRLVLLLIASIATASATLIVGPLSFVGLMAPHMARRLGMQRALPQLAGAASIGGGLLVAADWLGRNLLFPWQIPAGLVCALIGGPLFLLLMWQRR